MQNGTSKDAYDVWTYFMDQIQSFLLSEKRSKEKLVQETTALYQIFGGYIQSKLSCPSCNNSENNYNSFLHLSLDLTQCSSVERCFTKHFKEKVSQQKECASCQHEGDGFSGAKSVYRPPMTLAIQLQRFNQGGDKINKAVKFEEQMDISRIITETEKSKVNLKYNLYAMIAHTGQTINDGHYMAYVKSSNGIWYCMDNDNVQVVSLKRLMEEKPYMLFYSVPPKVVKREIKKKVEPVKKTVPVAVSEDSDSEKEDVQQGEEEEEEEIELAETVEEDNDDEEKLKKAMEEASNKEKVENAAAIVVDHNENMKSKREKLGALIEKESAVSKSAQVKDALLSSIPSNQFQDDIDTWGNEDLGVGEKRKKVLKDVRPKRKRVDMYDLDYDRGKLKKVKKKQEDRFNKPNMFQITAEKTADKKKKNLGKRKKL